MTDIAVKLPVADYIGDELRILDLLIYHAKANKKLKKCFVDVVDSYIIV